MNAIETQSQIQRSIGDLQQLRDQWSGVESIDKEREKAEAKLAGVKANIVAMRGEFNEVRRAHDEILKKAQAAQTELQRMEREIKKRKGELAAINAELAKIPDKLRGFDKFVADLRRESDKLAQLNDGLNAIRVEAGA